MNGPINWPSIIFGALVGAGIVALMAFLTSFCAPDIEDRQRQAIHFDYATYNAQGKFEWIIPDGKEPLEQPDE